jgi:hypothetical protein
VTVRLMSDAELRRLEPELRTNDGARHFAQHLPTKAAERLRHGGYYCPRFKACTFHGPAISTPGATRSAFTAGSESWEF